MLNFWFRKQLIFTQMKKGNLQHKDMALTRSLSIQRSIIIKIYYKNLWCALWCREEESNYCHLVTIYVLMMSLCHPEGPTHGEKSSPIASLICYFIITTCGSSVRIYLIILSDLLLGLFFSYYFGNLDTVSYQKYQP